MRSSMRLWVVALLVAALGALPATVGASIVGKGGFVDLKLDRTGRPGTQVVQWFWWPSYEVGSAPYVVYVQCSCSDENGEPAGNMKIKLKVTLRGIDTNTTVTFPSRTIKLRNGEHEILVLPASGGQDITTIARELVVLGRGELQIKGRLPARYFLRCEVGVAELTGSDIVAAATP